MHATQPSIAPRRLQILDGVRGLAVLFVLLDHTIQCKALRFDLTWNLKRAGLLGVLLFFSLSAFLLTYPFFLRSANSIFEPRVWRNYVLRRFLRIFPLFLVALCVNVWQKQNFGGADVLNHLLLRDGQRHFWTIAVEVKYYFVLPAFILVAGLFWAGRWRWGVAAAVAAVIVIKFALFPAEAAWSRIKDIWLEKYYIVFLLGSAAALVHAWSVRRAWSFPRLRIGLDVLAFGCIALAVLRFPTVSSKPLAHGDHVKWFAKDTLTFGIVWAVFLLSVLHGGHLTRRVLQWTPLRNLGLISYSVYLWHPFILNSLDHVHWRTWLVWLVFVSSLLAVSAASYWLIERPLSRVQLPGFSRTKG